MDESLQPIDARPWVCPAETLRQLFDEQYHFYQDVLGFPEEKASGEAGHLVATVLRMTEEEFAAAHPPISPSWGHQDPASRLAGYGDVSFNPAEAEIPPRELTVRDLEMIARLPRILPTNRKAQK